MATGLVNTLRLVSTVDELSDFEFRCSREFSVSQFLTLIDYKVRNSYNLNDESCEPNIFDFLLSNNKIINACPEIYFYDFLDNFNIDCQQIHIEFDAGYQNGATGWDDYINLIFILERNTMSHMYTSRGLARVVYRMSLTTFIQMKGDGKRIPKEYNLNERKGIIKILKQSAKELIELYKRMKAGEYIDEYYCICEDGTEVSIIN